MKPAIPAALILALATAAPALACLNDRETLVLERMFRSSYQSPGNSALPADGTLDSRGPNLPQYYQWNWPAVVASAAGLLMMAGSAGIGRRKLARGHRRAD